MFTQLETYENNSSIDGSGSNYSVATIQTGFYVRSLFCCCTLSSATLHHRIPCTFCHGPFEWLADDFQLAHEANNNGFTIAKF